MRKLALVLVALGALVSCGDSGYVIYAQVPANLRVIWAPNPAGENIITYKVSVNGGPIVRVPPTPVTNAATCAPEAAPCVIHSFVATAFGVQTATVRATNLRLSGDTVEQDGPALTVTATLNPPPGAATRGAIRE